MPAASSCDTVTVWPGSRRPMWTAGSDSCVLTLWWSGENAVMAFQAVSIYSELVTMESPQDMLISGHAVFKRTYSKERKRTEMAINGDASSWLDVSGSFHRNLC